MQSEEDFLEEMQTGLNQREELRRKAQLRLERMMQIIDASAAVVKHAKVVHKKVTSMYRTQACVLRLKDAVESLLKLENEPPVA